MNRILVFLVVFCLVFTSCSYTKNSKTPSNTESTSILVTDSSNPNTFNSGENAQSINFPTLNDDALLQYIEDNIYAELDREILSEDYRIEDITAIFISQEYIEELTYNSKSNIYFGHKLSDIEKQFDGKRFIFSLGPNDQTIAREFEAYNNEFEDVIRNVAIGSGVILICVTISLATAGTGTAPAVTAIFAASAKTGTTVALSSGILAGVTEGIITGIESGDMNVALKASLKTGSEAFKWGAITGVVTGGAGKAIQILRKSKTVPTPIASEKAAALKYGGKEQVSYLNGKEVTKNVAGATRPDIVREFNNKLEAIEVKNYDLRNNLTGLLSKLKQQVRNRNEQLPAGSLQRVVLDVTGRGYQKDFIQSVIEKVQTELNPIYKQIPVDILNGH